MTNPKKNGDLMLRVRYDSGAELAGPAVITDEGALLVSLGGAASMLVQRADGSLPPHITFVDIRPSHVGYGLPLTDDMVCMAVTAMLRDAVGLTLGEASDAYEAWLNRVKRATIEHEARVGLPRMWEHPRRTRTRRGGVVASMVGGYTAILLVRQPNGVENSIRRQCSTLNEAEKWLDEQIGEDE